MRTLFLTLILNIYLIASPTITVTTTSDLNISNYSGEIRADVKGVTLIGNYSNVKSNVNSNVSIFWHTAQSEELEKIVNLQSKLSTNKNVNIGSSFKAKGDITNLQELIKKREVKEVAQNEIKQFAQAVTKSLQANSENTKALFEKIKELQAEVKFQSKKIELLQNQVAVEKGINQNKKLVVVIDGYRIRDKPSRFGTILYNTNAGIELEYIKKENDYYLLADGNYIFYKGVREISQ